MAQQKSRRPSTSTDTIDLFDEDDDFLLTATPTRTRTSSSSPPSRGHNRLTKSHHKKSPESLRSSSPGTLPMLPGTKASPEKKSSEKKGGGKGKDGLFSSVEKQTVLISGEKSDDHPVVKALRRREGPWLGALTGNQIIALAQMVETIKFGSMDVVYAQGDKGVESKCFWILLDGYVKGVKADNKGGEERLFSQRAPGSTFGESSLFGGCAREYSLVCITKTQMLKVTHDMYASLFNFSMEALEKVRMVSTNATVRSSQMKKDACMLFQNLNQADVYRAAESTSLLVFHEGDVIIRQGDCHTILGPYAQQVYMLDAGSVNIYVTGLFEEYVSSRTPSSFSGGMDEEIVVDARNLDAPPLNRRLTQGRTLRNLNVARQGTVKNALPARRTSLSSPKGSPGSRRGSVSLSPDKLGGEGFTSRRGSMVSSPDKDGTTLRRGSVMNAIERRGSAPGEEGSFSRRASVVSNGRGRRGSTESTDSGRKRRSESRKGSVDSRGSAGSRASSKSKKKSGTRRKSSPSSPFGAAMKYLDDARRASIGEDDDNAIAAQVAAAISAGSSSPKRADGGRESGNAKDQDTGEQRKRADMKRENAKAGGKARNSASKKSVLDSEASAELAGMDGEPSEWDDVKRNVMVEKEVLIATLDKPGTIFGEVACMMGCARTATVKAGADCRVYMVKKVALDRIVHENSDVLDNVLGLLQTRKKHTSKILANVGCRNVEEEEDWGHPAAGGAKMTRAEIMEMFVKAKAELQELNIKDMGDEYVKMIEDMFGSVAQSLDWNAGGGNGTALSMLNHVQRVYDKFQEEGERVHRNLPEGYDIKSLEKLIVRIERVKTLAEDVLPDTPRTKTERLFRQHTQQRLLKSQLQYFMENLRNQTLESQFTTVTKVCEYIEKNPQIVKEMEEAVNKESLAGGFGTLYQFKKKHGKELGTKIYSTLMDWYQKKCDGWRSCHEMLCRQHNIMYEIRSLHNRIKQSPHLLKGDEKRRIWVLEQARKDAVVVENKVRESIKEADRRIVRACFIDAPPLPTGALSESPLLQFALRLQNIVEVRENHRIAVALVLRTANSHVMKAVSDANALNLQLVRQSLRPSHKHVTEETWNIDRDEYGNREIAPSMTGYIDNLGNWLFTKDERVWDRQAAYLQRAAMITTAK